MSYAAALEILNRITPELYTAPGQTRRKFSLVDFHCLLKALGNPEKQFKSVLIAGTNGKGSTASTLASILGASGSSTGLYTSPHLERVNERVRLNGEEISEEDFGRIFFQVHDCAEDLVNRGELPYFPSFFEILTALAFVYFADKEVDLAVLEVGMGGRLDATNVVHPLVSVITDISLDHTDWLGSTIAEITREKAGILRQNGVMVTLPQHPEANQTLGDVAISLDVRGVSAAAFMPPMGLEPNQSYLVEVLGQPVRVDSPLHGSHQHRNLALAIATAAELAEHHGFPISAQAIESGIRATRWPGRLEELRYLDKRWILDVAHNPAGAWALRSGLNSSLVAGESSTLLFSCLRDKPLTEMAQILFPLFDRVVLSPIANSRAASIDSLSSVAEDLGVTAIAAKSVAEAVQLAQQGSGMVVVSGSVYLVGEVRGYLLRNQGETR